MASGDLLLLRAHGGAPVLARAFACRLLVPGRRRSGLVSPLAASKVGIADVVGRVRSGDADQKRRRRDAEEGVATRRELLNEEEEEENGGETGGVDGSYLSETRFDQCAISPLSLKAVKDAGYERMTEVQEATLPIILQGKDVLAKAKTGTGKTVAFLLPAIEVLSTLPRERNQLRPPINLLVMCPTRELANQVAVEARKLLRYHRSLGVQVVIGGTRLTQEQRSMQANPCQILVATPGRLKDHLENTPGFSSRLKGVKVLVLDEADRLLDMGFRRDIEKIIASIPRERQTLLFSATVPEEVRQISHVAMKKDYRFVNTVKEGDEETNAQVSQMYMVAPLDLHFSILYDVLKKHIAEDADYKVIIFCTTAMVTKLVAEVLSQLKLNIREIHSRKSQSARTKVSDEFRKSKGLILVSSDVSARGVDYPDVTLVIQVGIPADREQYIHRLGRTGRKGKEGQGLLLLAPWEKYFLGTVKDLSIAESAVPPVDSSVETEVKNAVRKVEMNHHDHEIEKCKQEVEQVSEKYFHEKSALESEIERLQEVVKNFERNLTEVTGEKLQLEAQVKELEQVSNNLEDSSAEIRKLQEIIKDLQARLENDSNDKGVLEERAMELEQVRRQLADSRAETRELQATIKDLKEDLEKVLQEKAELQNHMKDVEQATNDLNSLVASLKGKLTATEAQLEQLHVEKAEASLESEKHLSQLIQAIAHLKTEIQLLSSEKAEVENKVSVLLIDVTTRDEKLKEMDNHLHQLHLEHVKLIEEADIARKDVSGLRSRVCELEEEVEKQKLIISDSAEGKREAIRQLCFSLDHYRHGYQQLRQLLQDHKRPVVMAT